MVAVAREDPGVTSRTARRRDIQGLRAVAVVVVVLFHADALPGGFTGVDVFFVISGFVITGMLLRERATAGRVSIKGFYARRVRRLMPGLALALASTLLLSALLAPVGAISDIFGTGVGAALVSANVYLFRSSAGYFDVGAGANALRHTWSLSVEEQFYLVYPGALVLTWFIAFRMGRWRNLAVAAALCAAILASFWLSLTLSGGRPSVVRLDDIAKQFAFYSSPTRAWEFGVGALVAIVTSSYRFPRIVSAVGSWAALVALATCVFTYDSYLPFPGVAALLPVLATAVLLSAGNASSFAAGSILLSNRVAQWLGDVSYSWYLWHWPMIVFAKALWMNTRWPALAAAALSLIPAIASYRWIENPIRFRQAPLARALIIAMVCVAAPLAAAGGLHVASRLIRSSDGMRTFQRALRPHVDDQRGCNNETPLGKRALPRCTWRVEGSAFTAILLGDSNAGQFSEPFIDAATRSGFSATVATSYGCPFLDVVVVRGGTTEERCRRFYVETRDFLRLTRPDVVFLSSATDIYPVRRDIQLVGPGRTKALGGQRQKERIVGAGLRAAVQSLTEVGTRVVIVHPIPKFEPWDPQKCAAIRVWLAPRSCGVAARKSKTEAFRRPALTAERSVLAPPAVVGLDVAPDLCPARSCDAYDNGRWQWRNGGHLTVDASRLLSDRFFGALHMDAA